MISIDQATWSKWLFEVFIWGDVKPMVEIIKHDIKFHKQWQPNYTEIIRVNPRSLFIAENRGQVVKTVTANCHTADFRSIFRALTLRTTALCWLCPFWLLDFMRVPQGDF